MTRATTLRIATTVLILALAVSAGWAAQSKVSIEVENKAKGDGEISFTFTPTGGEAKEIKVGVITKMKADEIARDIMKQFSLALGDSYKVKQNGSSVQIKGIPASKHDEPPTFELVLSGNSVSGVAVAIE
jgi:hypothetical protein